MRSSRWTATSVALETASVETRVKSMTDTTIRVTKETRQRLKIYAGMIDGTQDDAINDALDAADAPDVEGEE
jgi:hypothetical protein